MREGLTYISFITSKGGILREEIRGQIGASSCFESSLFRNSSSPPIVDGDGLERSPYSFGNILLSVEATDLAVLIQAPADLSRSPGNVVAVALDFGPAGALNIVPTDLGLLASQSPRYKVVHSADAGLVAALVAGQASRAI
mmetsp:Transcript_29622/g.78017  ORF Transcript_29622/g.78017 Transcript_29622/m.78017 type:complete len:141 (+) Transcript_29622:411-833(+)